MIGLVESLWDCYADYWITETTSKGHRELGTEASEAVTGRD